MERIRDAIQKARRARTGDGDILHESGDSQKSGQKNRSNADSAWSAIPDFLPDARHFQKNRVITMTCEDPAYSNFDILRTKILSTMKLNGWRSLGITSPSPHCGKTMVSSNLAFSFARQTELRTVLIDLDLRRPQLSRTLGLQPGPSMATFLSGTSDPTSQFVRFQNNLAIGASSSSQKHSSELLTGSQTKRSIDALFDALQPDVVLYDMPPLLASDDTLAFLPNVDCTLLIIEADRTTVSEVDEAEQLLAEKSSLLGVVLNKSRFEAESYAYYYD